MLDLLEAHPTTEGVPALLALYESGPCSNCRCRALELLHTLDTMPAWILREAPFDASADIRQKLTEWATPAASTWRRRTLFPIFGRMSA